MRILFAILLIGLPVLGQTPGKNQLCDKSGNCATVTGSKLDVNATATAGPVGTAAKGTTTSGSPTSTNASTNRQPLDVILYDASGNAYTAGGGASDAAATAGASESATNRSASFSAVRLLDTAQLAGLQLVAWRGDQTSGAWVNVKSSVLPTGAATDRSTAGSPFSMRLSDGAAFLDPRSIRALTSADVVSAAQSGTWTIGVNNFPATQPVSGTVTAGQGTAAAASGAWPTKITDGTTIAAVDATLKALHVSERPLEAVGCYSVNARTPTYGGLAAAAPLVQFRNPSATILVIVLRLRVQVMTTVSATTAGGSQREVVIGRSWTVSDTGTAISLAGNNNKLRTSLATSIVDMKVGGSLTAGTRTLDGNGIGSGIFWMPLSTVGVALAPTYLIDVNQPGKFPVVLAQNEGVLVRIGPDAQPTGATNQTYTDLDWCEATSY